MDDTRRCDGRHRLGVTASTMICPLDSSPRGPTQEEARNMAEKKISPKAPEQVETSAARTAAARVSKKQLHKKQLHKKQLHKKQMH
jgi:hypothetical protein